MRLLNTHLTIIALQSILYKRQSNSLSSDGLDLCRRASVQDPPLEAAVWLLVGQRKQMIWTYREGHRQMH